MRTGAIWRQLTLVPLARIQSVALGRGPLARAQRLAAIEVHVVGTVITARLAAIDAQDAAAEFARIADGARDAIASDRSHRWRAGAEDGAPAGLRRDASADGREAVGSSETP